MQTSPSFRGISMLANLLYICYTYYIPYNIRYKNKERQTRCGSMGEKMCTRKACRNQITKKARSRVAATIIFVILIAMAVTACGNNVPANNAGNSQTQTTGKDGNEAFGIGEVAETKNIKVSMVSVTESTGSEFNKPADGNVFVLCEFEITNDSDSELSISSMLSFTAYCDDYACSYSLGALMEKGNSNQLDGTVAAGKKFKGVIGYEVPVGWEKLEVHFTPDIWSQDTLVFAAANS